MTGFRPFFNPATGEWIEFTTVAEDGKPAPAARKDRP
jgi:hypothetical protein